MKNAIKIFGILILCVFVFSGCRATAKKVTRPRTDQNLTDGNGGYLYGEAARERAKDRRLSREYMRIDIERYPEGAPVVKKSKGSKPEEVQINIEEGIEIETPTEEAYLEEDYEETAPEPVYVEETSSDVPKVSIVEEDTDQPQVVVSESQTLDTLEAETPIEIYIVKKNESLWDIAGRKEIYGNSLKWRDIYEANKDKIRNPDKIREGMRLKIPR